MTVGSHSVKFSAMAKAIPPIRWKPKQGMDRRTPKYLAIAECVEADIHSGALVPGAKLPSHRQLSALFGTTIATVTKAMSEAVRRGLVNAVVGSGTYVRGSSNAQPASDLIDLSLNTVPASVVQDILGRQLAKVSGDRFSYHLFDHSGYIPAPGLLKSGVRWVSSLGVPATESNLLLTNGVHQGLLASFELLLPHGAKAICEPLLYTGVKRIAQSRGITLLAADFDDDGIDPEGIERLISETGAKVVILTPVNHNPTTVTLSVERRQRIAEICSRLDAWIIEDGVNTPLSGTEIPSIYHFAPKRTIHLTGFSKCVASGFRLGIAVVPEMARRGFEEALIGSGWTGPGLFAHMANEMLSDGSIDACVQRHRQEADTRFSLALQLLPGVTAASCPTYHAWVKIPERVDPTNFHLQAQHLGVRVSPAAHFAISNERSDRHYRISLGGAMSRDVLRRALNTLASISTPNAQDYVTIT